MNWYQETLQNHPSSDIADVVSDTKLLYPPFRVKIEELLKKAKEQGLNVFVYETYRSTERQRELYKRGVTKLQRNSMHHFGVAADIKFAGKEKVTDTAQEEWNRLGSLGKSLGLHWGGDWEDFRDYPHFQLIPATKEEQENIATGKYPH